MPKHLAITTHRIRSWALKNNKDIKEATKQNVNKIKELIKFQLKKDIPILTIMVSTQTEEEIQALNQLFLELSKDEIIHHKKVRIYATGNWYDAEATMVDQIKKMLETTKDYDNYFINFCIRYDGQNEILTTAKLLVKKTIYQELKIDDLTKDSFKENMPTSNFMPPEIIIDNNWKYSGLLQWDSQNAHIILTNKFWMDYDLEEISKIIDQYNKYKEQQD